MRKGIIGVGPSRGEISTPNLSFRLAKAVTLILEKMPARWEFRHSPRLSHGSNRCAKESLASGLAAARNLALT